MTDNTQLINNAKAVPQEVLFGLKPSAVNSRSYYQTIAPQSSNQNITPGSTVTFRIPTGRRNQLIDFSQSYMKHTVKNNANAALKFDGCGASILNRLDILHGGNSIDNILNYNIVYNYLVNNTLTKSQRANLSASMGFNPTDTITFVNEANVTTSVSVGTVAGDKSGASIPAGASFTCSLPLLGSLFQCDKLVPIGLMSDDIQVDFLLETTAKALIGSASSDYSVSDFELNLMYVEVDDATYSEITSTFGEQLYLPTQLYRVSTIDIGSAVSGAYSALIPARFSSLKSMHHLPIPSTYQVATGYGLSASVNPNIASAQLRIGSQTTPNKPLDFYTANRTSNYSNAFMSVQRALHAVSNSEIEGVYTLTDFNVADNAIANTQITAIPAAGAYAPSFAFAFELESFAHKSSVMLAGMNTTGSQVFLDMVISETTGINYTVYNIAHADGILVLENGILSLRL